MTHFRTLDNRLYVGAWTGPGTRRRLVDRREDAVEFHHDQQEAIERAVGEKLRAAGLSDEKEDKQ